MGFLGRAKELIGGVTPPDPSQSQTQYYRVTCPEGHILRGARTEGYQAIRCPNCGEGVFILPRSPLPDPPTPPGAVPNAVPKPRATVPPPPPISDAPIEYQDAPGQFADADAEIEWEDSEAAEEIVEVQAETEVAPPQPARPAARKPNPASRPSPPRPAVQSGKPRPKPVPVPAAAAEEEEDGEKDSLEFTTARPKSRRRRSRTALVIFGVMALVALTIGFGIYKQRRQDLPRIAETNRVEGLAALRSGVLDVAKQKLAKAASALESLGDNEAANVRQSADEAAILADLASLSMEEIVEEVATKEDGPSRFEAIYRGRAVILDAEIEDRDDGVPRITYRILAGTGPKPKIGFVDLAGFRLLDDRKKGDRVTFGGRLASIGLQDDGRWAVALQPKSGVYIRSPEAWKALESLGWSSETTGAPKP